MENRKVYITSIQLSKHNIFVHFKRLLLFIPVLALFASCNKDSSSSSSSTSTAEGAYSQSSETITVASQTFKSSSADLCAITLSSTAMLTLSGSKINTTGSSSSTSYSRYYGLNSAIAAIGGSTLVSTGNKITTSGTGANGVFSYNASAVSLTSDTISTSGVYSSAIIASGAGNLSATNVVLTTTGDNSPAVAIDYGGGNIKVSGAKIQTSGADAPGISSKGTITVADAGITATGAEAAKIEGSNSISLTNSNLSSSKEDKWSVLIYQSVSGEASGYEGSFTMTGGSLSNTTANSPLFFITNTTGAITLKGVNLSAVSNTLIKVGAGSWGTSGANGGMAILTADAQVLKGNFVADKYGLISLFLKNGSTLTGAINSAKTAISANLTLDASSSWTLTADSYISTFSDMPSISGNLITNITGNGFNLYYETGVNSALEGKTYSLVNGGQLKPY